MTNIVGLGVTKDEWNTMRLLREDLEFCKKNLIKFPKLEKSIETEEPIYKKYMDKYLGRAA